LMNNFLHLIGDRVKGGPLASGCEVESFSDNFHG
jgi:hypothetical protein